MSGLTCPECGYTKSLVVDSRPCADGIRRRRECEKCGKRWRTYEFSNDMVKRIKNRAFLLGTNEAEAEAET